MPAAIASRLNGGCFSSRRQISREIVENECAFLRSDLHSIEDHVVYLSVPGGPAAAGRADKVACIVARGTFPHDEVAIWALGHPRIDLRTGMHAEECQARE